MATVVLVHGSFHAGWCWEAVEAGLQQRAVPTVVVDLPGRGRHPGPLGALRSSGEHLRERLAEIDGPLVVCGHSFGGMVISEAVPPEAEVRELVYLAALIPETGESMATAMPEMAVAPLSTHLTERDGCLHFDPAHAREIFYSDCAEEAVRWASARLGPEPREMFTETTTQAAFEHHPSCYVLCERDGAVPPSTQERMTKYCDRTIRWNSDHSPMLSQPETLVDLLTDLSA